LERNVRGGIRRAVIGNPELGVGERGAKRAKRRSEAIGLVASGHDHSEVRRHRRLSCQPMPDVEAHITGTVWKIECQVGQSVDEGDTLVILESMKMEMPVEAEDGGTVKEIRCSEGQSVSEGDTLVVLE
jgi:acetyl-CoA carboxylase biotin carboxyl carrier protein